MTLDQKIRKNGIIGGLLLGAGLLTLSIFSFYLITSITESVTVFIISPTLFSFILPIIMVVVFCYVSRKKIGGYWSFRQATTGIFIMFIIAYVFQVIGRDLIFAKLIEPKMVEKTEAAFIRESDIMKTTPGANKKQIDDNINGIKQNLAQQKNITVGQVISGTGINIVLIFVVALIFGTLFKKDPPVYYSAEEKI
ncbi:DUF4199 domain-containing protein [Mucilaginibacter sp.]|uniref:DUF4199 domain-containing protein n=1 Tax=Mucilaginibacter sp. TaxID=1882438 RepID=UPI003D13580A